MSNTQLELTEHKVYDWKYENYQKKYYESPTNCRIMYKPLLKGLEVSKRQTKASIIIRIENRQDNYFGNSRIIQTYVLPCGYSMATANGHNNNWIVKHVNRCKACRILAGLNSPTVLSNEETISLFFKGRDGFRGPSVESSNNILTYDYQRYVIRLADGKYVRNSQVLPGGGMFPKLPDLPTGQIACNLPLTTISRQVSNHLTSDNITQNINIIEIQENRAFVSSVVFSIFESREQFDRFNEKTKEWEPVTVPAKTRYFLYGIDEGHEFLAELPGPVNSYNEAIEILKPELVKECEAQGFNIKRQGDIFFIEFPDIQDYEVKDIKKARIINGLKYTPVIKDLKTLYVNSTNHEVQQKGFIEVTGRGLRETAKGYVRHRNRQHSKIQLGENWHVVEQNTAVRSWNVERRSSGGMD